MDKRAYPLLLLILLSAAFLVSRAGFLFKEEPAEEIFKEEEREFPKIAFSSEKPEQGDSLLIKIEGAEKPRAEFLSENLDFMKSEKGSFWLAFAGIDAKQEPGIYKAKIEIKGFKTAEKEIEVLKRDFPVTKLVVTEELAEKGYSPSQIAENIAKRENVLLREAVSAYTEKPYFKGSFGYPLERTKNVGAFGNIRKSGEIGLQHLGVDLEASAGETVYALNAGKVCFVKGMTNYGNTLVIDHGLGIFSLYLHLDEFKAAEGELVKKGQVIGLAGNTGYSIAPHLHLSLKIKGASVDPLRFIETSQEQMKEPALLLLAGDIMLDRGVELEMERENTWKWPFLKIKSFLSEADLLFANLEGPVSDKGRKVGSIYSFRANPRSIEGISWAGFDVLSLANNHMLDYQTIALEDTMNILKEKGISYVGAGFSENQAFSPLIKEVNSNRIAFLAYTDLGPESWKAGKDYPGLAWIGKADINKVKRAVLQASEKADIVIVSLHSGQEYSKEPTPFQVSFSEACIDSGASLVIGHHPHVLQKTEKYKQGYIAYSLGNFVFDQDWSEETRESRLLKIFLEKGRIKEVEEVEVLINKRFQPEIIHGKESIG